MKRAATALALALALSLTGCESLTIDDAFLDSRRAFVEDVAVSLIPAASGETPPIPADEQAVWADRIATEAEVIAAYKAARDQQ